MLSDETKELASMIGFFYLEKNNHDYIKAEEEIKSLHITALTIKENSGSERNYCNPSIEITIGRPGLLIGPKGTNIEKLAKHLGRNILIKEDVDNLLSYLIPQNPNS